MGDIGDTWSAWEIVFHGGSLPATRDAPDAPKVDADQPVTDDSDPETSRYPNPLPATQRFLSSDQRGFRTVLSPVIPSGWSPCEEPVTVAVVLPRLPGPAVDGESLTLPPDTPPELLRLVAVLHTGIRAALAGRRWCGCESASGRTVVLDTEKPVPLGVTLLCVEYDRRCWDRLPHDAVANFPELFGPALPRHKGHKRKGSVRRATSHYQH